MTELRQQVSTEEERNNGTEVYLAGSGVFTIPLEQNEMKVFDCIGKGYNNKVSLKNLAGSTNMDSRTVSALINSMRMKGVPIGSDRTKGGYYICKNESERDLTLLQFEADMNTKQQTYNSLINASLDNWEIAEAK